MADMYFPDAQIESSENIINMPLAFAKIGWADCRFYSMSTEQAAPLVPEVPWDPSEADSLESGSDDGEGMLYAFTGGMDEKTYAPAREYEYTSLKSWANIRVLDILPTTDPEDPIICQLRLTAVNDPHPYLAVSYAWGHIADDGSHLDHVIFCDGTPLNITSSLHAGLKRIREAWMTQASLTLWVDGICIDQSNQAERAIQVMLMDEIYSNCLGLMV
ncbi:uncharacterized protein LTR77_007662 [Saxophila tyrrhenica]|uniref:Heterokaryon incompatibility domain-containing protein n=1 Tax=Saxophila tyrrhenica TaxID=1690608 RepID=A0AAV9P6R1_9PEZI|nr:hypothetical protein LTR77_007662 [Saxophila tyrrhenica]